ncbi:MAG: T9SS type A sorting domain-containing protein [Paludibacteraceae bacterium]|nr:T9SS type A sorting domain-containing protein [Paludibacteraceae bacterium]
MRKLIKTYSLATIFLFTASCFAQETVIDQYQYWFDNDFENSAVTIAADMSNNSALTENISTDGLQDGTHTFHFRAHDTNGRWSSVKGMLFIKNMARWTNAEQNKVQRIQLWFDNDYDNAQTTSIEHIGENVIYTTSLDVDALRDGIHTLQFRFQDLNGLWSSAKGMLFIKNMAQWTNVEGNGISAFQYWVDNDYDNAETSTANDKTDFLLNTAIDLNTLKSGAHFFYSRFQDKNGKWSSVQGKLFIKEPTNNTGMPENSIRSMQWWIDNDFDKAEHISVSESKNAVFTADFDLNNYDDGIHILCYRFRDKNGTWSSTASQFFMKNTADLTHAENKGIRAMQYWIDNDFENASMLTAGGNDISILKSIETSALNDGLHVLNFRFADNSNVWSATASQFFIKGDAILPAGNAVTHLQYWFDNDFESNEKIRLEENADITFLNKINANALENGLHVLNFRFADKKETWSATASQFLFKSDANATANAITAIRYWFDNDYLNAQIADITPLNPSVTEKINTETLGNGLHVLNFHFMDKNGVWSSTASQYVFKDGSMFSTKDNKIVAYQYWKNDDFENAVYTKLENAANSVTIDDKIDFIWIEKGDYIMNYRFEDANGKWSSVISDTITKISLPMAEFKVDTIGRDCKNLTLAFSGRIVDGDVYLWNFGDGATTDTTLTPEHAFDKGDYEISLTVSDTETQKEMTVKLPVTFVPDIFRNEFYETACGFYTWADTVYAESGEYEKTFQNAYGCDSIVTLHLTVNHEEFLSLTDTVTIGNSYEKNGFAIPSDSIDKVKEYTFNLYETTSQGCDSIVTLKLIVVSRPEDGLFDVYYNKAKGVLGVVVPPQALKHDIEIFDALGRKRYTIPIDTENDFYATDLEPGVYLLRCGDFVKKIIVGY